MLDFTLERARAYLADVITKIINGHPNGRVLPWAYPTIPALRYVA